ncbi:DEAD/DEAH box helicase [Sinorhizobium meliloti]|uniref:DEAD/DEAH box helicase n=1 Tax=Rhizobium meliloti TaxID=382 RepID=UPI0020740008|nr:DEAD/DEAH box helicase [Sinorhizobium meliloti]MCM5693322.1 DEAD/DEAH box helicase [Sinorhizobium meliloti]
MFDVFTTALIASAPRLEGLDLEDLPKRLTQAFADVVSARLRFRGNPDAQLPEALTALLLEMRRIAASHEALVALLPDRENRAAAAFVAAAAHQAFALGENVRGVATKSYISSSSVSADVCATLLFLIAEAHADAAEAAKRIVVADDAPNVERALLLAVVQLARGQLQALSSIDVPQLDDALSLVDQAIQALQLELLSGLRNLAAQLVRREDLSLEEGGVESATAFFRRVKALSIDRIDGIIGEGEVFSLFPGPLHMANLLLAVERDLIDSGIARVLTPNGVAEDGWWQIIRRMARERPYLWRNHRDAISQGYLERGISAAISFPTGGGKSTLAELKIAVALLLGQQVVFLAPTNALVDQTTTSLKKTFKEFEILGDMSDETSLDTLLILPEVIVTTPERCLFLMSIQPELFENLGLIVFDECHLLHPREADRSRRAIDAMLAVLNLAQIAPSADLLLLSAMMKNTIEMARWIEEMTGRKCLPLDIAWKPTRQVRGSVVYPAGRINELNEILVQARKDFPKKKNGAPAPIERQLTAPPFGLFCLLQTWASTDREDYALLPLIDQPPHFTTAKKKKGGWRLTPNGNKLSAALAASAAASRIKTLVFVGSEVLAHSGAKEFKKELPVRSIALTDEEQRLYNLAAEEMGGAEYCYLKLDDNGIFRGGATSHHALLLREERHLHESLFKRKDGIDALFATSTLAQGMNLPSEIVIISGDSRFDPAADKMETLEAHELLNAAGRAGRAGESSQGFVLVVPSRVIDFDDNTGQLDDHWDTLKKIFEQGDQCLVIDDPLSNLLDRIHDGIAISGMSAYLLSKLPLSSGDDPDLAARNMLQRSFAAYRARSAGNEEWVSSRIYSALSVRKKEELSDDVAWMGPVAGSTGVPTSLLKQIWDLIENGKLSGTAEEIIKTLLAWIAEMPECLFDMARPENIEGLFGEEYKKLGSDRERAEYALPTLSALLSTWLSGAPLSEMEKRYLQKDDVGLCKISRHFALRVVPDLAFIGGLPAQLLRAKALQQGGDPTSITVLTILAVLPTIIREGCDSPESLAVRLNLGRTWSRPKSREQFERYVPFITASDAQEDFDETRERLRTAANLFLLNEAD